MSKFKKLPRGVIYHSLSDSIQCLFRSIVSPLDQENIVSKFEVTFAKYCERKYCVAFPFARTAIYYVLKHLNLPKGSEIIMPPITIKGIVDVVVDQGLIPVYIELDPKTICFQIEDLKKKLNSNVKASIITPLFGLVPEMSSIVSVLRDNGVYIIEDFSQCLNGRFDGKRVGTFGDVGVYSASSIKTLDTLGGGLAITDDQDMYDGLMAFKHDLPPANRMFLIKKAWVNFVRNMATTNPFFSMLTFPLLQLIRWLSPESALKQTGHRDKCRLSKIPDLWFCKYTSVQAELGLSIIDTVHSSDKMRVANAERIRSVFANMFPATTTKSSNVFWQLFVHTPDARKAQFYFSKRGIDVASSSLELASALSEYPGKVSLPFAESVYHDGVFLPCFPCLSAADINRIEDALAGYCEVIHGDVMEKSYE